MRSTMTLLLLASALGACSYKPGVDFADRGITPTNVPVVQQTNYALDVAAPAGTMLAGEEERLNNWFQALRIGYGDAIYVDGPMSAGARVQVAQVAARYGLLIRSDAPVTTDAIPAGSVRVVVRRAKAHVPNCPNWSLPAQPNYNNRSYSNHGCAVSANYASMIANPEDLIYGRDAGTTDAATGAKALGAYRSNAPTGAGTLSAPSSKGN